MSNQQDWLRIADRIERATEAYAWSRPGDEAAQAYQALKDAMLVCPDTIVEALRAAASLDKAVEALRKTRSIVSEGAMEGFNPLTGDWAERLFANQADISAALKAVASPELGDIK